MEIERITIKVEHDFRNEMSICFRTEVDTWNKHFTGEIIVSQDDFKSNFDMLFDSMKETIRKEILKSDTAKDVG